MTALAAELALRPIRRFGFEVAPLFSDILAWGQLSLRVNHFAKVLEEECGRMVAGKVG
jgi:hypothetical protein